MESFSWGKWPDFERGKWREDLRDKDFWLNRDSRPYLYLPRGGRYICWSVGVGPVASFTKAISISAVERLRHDYGPFKHVIKVDLKPAPTADGGGIMSIKHQLAIAAARELGLLGQEYNRLKEQYEALHYYSYGSHYAVADASSKLEHYVKNKLVPPIVGKLSAENCLLAVENLQWPIELGSLTVDAGLPPPMWTDSRWFISTTSQDVYNRSKSGNDGVISIDRHNQVVLLALNALHDSSEHIFNMIRQENKEYWHHIALLCFHYAMVIFTKQSQVVPATSDELIHQWAAQGILPRMPINEEKEETSTCSCTSSSRCAYMHRVGRVILEAFQKYSLLQLPYSPASDADGATGTAAQFFAYHGLITEDITVDALFENKKNWISFVDAHGWHVSREWLSQEETRGPTALILRGCSQQSLILSKLDHFLLKLCFLRILDLSYTPLKSLPSSIGSLLNLRLLSLRGCHDLKTLFSSSTTSATDSSTNTGSYSPLSTLFQLEILDTNGVPFSHLTQDVGNKKSNLIYLDMSYSEVTIFAPNFFKDMLNLEELILVNCSNLVEVPPSMAALSSLKTLEIRGTQIQYIPHTIFEAMQKLKSLKLIDNKKLISFAQPISRANGSIDVHTEGYETTMLEKIKLEGHPTLISFLLIGAPHIRRLSLRGCRKLESVEVMHLDALEELDLSGTAIKELSAGIPNLPQLSRLLLVGVSSLRRFPWHMLERLPNVFYLDHCAEGNGNHPDQVAQVCVSDPRFFYSFNDTSVRFVKDGRFFQRFYVRVASCITNCKQLQDEGMIDSKLQVLVQKQSTYVDVCRSCFAEKVVIASALTIPLHRTERHVEITGMQSSLGGLHHLLNVTKSISVTCDASIKFFGHLSRLSNFVDLEECDLRWCPKMEGVFFSSVEGLKNLRNVHVRNIRSLVWFCSEYRSIAFSSLAHLHLEDCPRLEHVLTDRTTLPCLKTLDILFCYNLKTIFIIRNAYHRQAADICELPSLQRIRLQELPLLQHFHDDATTLTAPMWKELHVRGCWSLQRLPRLDVQPTEKVKVSGERRWWSKLQWGSPSHRNGYEAKLPPKFASFDEHAVMTSYLR